MSSHPVPSQKRHRAPHEAEVGSGSQGLPRSDGGSLVLQPPLDPPNPQAPGDATQGQASKVHEILSSDSTTAQLSISNGQLKKVSRTNESPRVRTVNSPTPLPLHTAPKPPRRVGPPLTVKQTTPAERQMWAREKIQHLFHEAYQEEKPRALQISLWRSRVAGFLAAKQPDEAETMRDKISRERLAINSARKHRVESLVHAYPNPEIWEQIKSLEDQTSGIVSNPDPVLRKTLEGLYVETIDCLKRLSYQVMELKNDRPDHIVYRDEHFEPTLEAFTTSIRKTLQKCYLELRHVRMANTILGQTPYRGASEAVAGHAAAAAARARAAAQAKAAAAEQEARTAVRVAAAVRVAPAARATTVATGRDETQKVARDVARIEARNQARRAAQRERKEQERKELEKWMASPQETPFHPSSPGRQHK
jgi:hypothetical protein